MIFDTKKKECQYSPKNANEAAAIAFQLALNSAKNRVELCELVTHSSVEQVLQQIEEAKSKGEFTPLNRSYGSLFSNTDFLNISFLKASKTCILKLFLLKFICLGRS